MSITNVSDRERIHDNDSRSMRMAILAQHGDPRAAEWLYRHYSNRIRALMHRIVGPQDAEDVTQQCFLVMLRRIGSFGGKSSFWTWFYRLSVNEALQHLRSKHKRPMPTVAVESLCAPERESVEDREAVEYALNRLPQSQRMVLTLHVQDGLSYRDISERLSIPMGTVGSRINQAKAYMARSLQGDQQNPLNPPGMRQAA